VAARSKVLVVGWVLIGLIAACLFAVALIATFEGGGSFGVDARVAGRLGTFVPVVYVPLLLILVAVGAYWAWRQFRRRSNDPSNSTVDTDARKSGAAKRGR
jgi:uncharacterized membrane protein